MNNLDNFYNSVISSVFNSFKIIFNYSKKARFELVKQELREELRRLSTQDFESLYDKMIAYKELLLDERFDELYRDAIKVKKSQDAKIKNCKAEYHKLQLSEKKVKIYVIVNGGINWIFYLEGNSFKKDIKKTAEKRYREKEDKKHYWLTGFTNDLENNEFRICLTKMK